MVSRSRDKSVTDYWLTKVSWDPSCNQFKNNSQILDSRWNRFDFILEQNCQLIVRKLLTFNFRVVKENTFHYEKPQLYDFERITEVKITDQKTPVSSKLIQVWSYLYSIMLKLISKNCIDIKFSWIWNDRILKHQLLANKYQSFASRNLKNNLSTLYFSQ